MKQLLFYSFLSVFIVMSCKNDQKENSSSDANSNENASETTSVILKDRSLTIKLEPKSGSKATGSILFKQEKDVVTMLGFVNGLEDGEYAMHIHEKSDCSAEDGTSTGGHWNPTNENHGKWGNKNGYHKGDIGNFKVTNGNGSITFNTSQWCIGCNDPNKDILGKAIIVHAGVDDFTTQPTGNAGGRVSCGGIIE